MVDCFSSFFVVFAFFIASCLFCCLEITKLVFSHYLEVCFLVLISRCDGEKLDFFVVLVFTGKYHSKDTQG